MTENTRAMKRISKELEKFISDHESIWIDNVQPMRWRIGIKGAEKSLYAKEIYHLIFVFTNDYPMTAPTVTFEKPPVHEHIYSNGHLCLNVLYDDWSPALTCYNICLSIVSMMSSATEKKTPPDDAAYSKSSSRDPKKTMWHFHDEAC